MLTFVDNTKAFKTEPQFKNSDMQLKESLIEQSNKLK